MPGLLTQPSGARQATDPNLLLQPGGPPGSFVSSYQPATGERISQGINNLLQGVGISPFRAGQIGGGAESLWNMTPMAAAEDAGYLGGSGNKTGAAIAALGAIPGAKPETEAARSELARLKAYHGSPHSFDQFDLSKIGTGEGAQAYGHGLYFADNEAVAKGYRDALSKQVTFQGAPVGTHPMDNALEGAKHSIIGLVSDGMSPQDAIAQVSAKWRADAQPYIEFGKQNPEHAAMAAEHAKSFTDIADAAATLNPADFVKNPGHMYEVNINADPSQLLDWDKPLSEQSPHVQNALGTFNLTGEVKNGMPLGNNASLRIEQDPDLPEVKRYFMQTGGTEFRLSERDLQNFVAQNPQQVRGNNILSTLATQYGNEDAASKALQDAGIPGIQYLDAGSRTAGEGSRNYVVFDPKIIDIVRKYGIAGAIAAGALTAEQARQLSGQQGNQQWLQQGGT
jgi:hypothetical protein